jgi:hypothetical protein
VRIVARTPLGTVAVDLETEEAELLGVAFELPLRTPLEISLPLLVDAAVAGSRIVAVVDRRPPLVVSDDAGLTWTEAGGGLPGGRAVAVSENEPDLVVYAARNRLYVSHDGGRFWRALRAELPEIEAIALVD